MEKDWIILCIEVKKVKIVLEKGLIPKDSLNNWNNEDLTGVLVQLAKNSTDEDGVKMIARNFKDTSHEEIPSVTNWCSFLVLSITSIGIIAGFGFFVLGSLDVAKKDTRDGLKEVKKDTRDGLKEVKKDTLEGLKEIMRLFEIHAADEKKRYEQVMEVYRSRQAK